MRIEFILIDDEGKRYSGSAELVDVPGGVSEALSAATYRGQPSEKEDSLTRALPNHILRLRDEGFFREPRTSTEVHDKLQQTYSCLSDRVQMALLRLQRRRELRKATKKIGDREKTAYVW